MPQLSDDDYYELDMFVKAVLTRVYESKIGVGDGHRALMHVLGAWDRQNWTEFAPWMRVTREEWERHEA